MTDKLSMIPLGAYGFGSVVAICITYIFKGNNASVVGHDDVFTVNNKLDWQFSTLMTRLNDLENSLSTFNNDVKFQTVNTIYLLGKRINYKITEDEIHKFREGARNRKTPFYSIKSESEKND